MASMLLHYPASQKTSATMSVVEYEYLHFTR